MLINNFYLFFMIQDHHLLITYYFGPVMNSHISEIYRTGRYGFLSLPEMATDCFDFLVFFLALSSNVKPALLCILPE